jgi:hypothetical protein
MGKVYEFEWEKHTCGECTQFGDKRSRLCSHLPAEHKACASFKSPPTVFDRITASPEMLAPYFVFLKAFIVTNINPQQQWISTLTGEVYPTRAEALAATVAKLKEVVK